MLLLPGNRIALSSTGTFTSGTVENCFLEKGTFDSPELELESKTSSLPMDSPGALALSPQKNLLVAGSWFHEV